MTKPSDFPRDEKFRDPARAPFRDADGNYHVFSYEDVMRVLLNREEAFSRDPAPWLPPGVRHMGLDFMWVYEPVMIDGKEPRHDLLRSVVEPWLVWGGASLLPRRRPGSPGGTDPARRGAPEVARTGARRDEARRAFRRHRRRRDRGPFRYDHEAAERVMGLEPATA